MPSNIFNAIKWPITVEFRVEDMERIPICILNDWWKEVIVKEDLLNPIHGAIPLQYAMNPILTISQCMSDVSHSVSLTELRIHRKMYLDMLKERIMAANSIYTEEQLNSPIEQLTSW